MLKDLKFIFLATTPFVMAFTPACSSEQNIQTDDLKSHVCSEDNLHNTAKDFLTHLLENDTKSAIQYYAEGYKKQGEGFGLNYTFFPKNDPNALFDIIKKNSESPIFVDLMGDYQKGKLVGYFQNTAEGKTRKIEYLSNNHWKTFVVCNFECIDGEWKISGETCFEDSGSPFE